MATAVMPVRIALKAWRTDRGMTQAQLSELSGVHQPTISLIEAGRAKMVSLDVIERLCKALQIQPGQLFEEAPAKRRKGK